MSYENKERCWDEVLALAKEFIEPYLDKNRGLVEIGQNGQLLYTYNSTTPIVYELNVLEYYDDLIHFLSLSIKGYSRGIALYLPAGDLCGRSTRPARLIKQILLPILDNFLDPRDYSVIVRIIYSLIRHDIYTKNDFVDNLKDTKNIPALMEIIKYDDFTVMTPKDERFNL